MTNLTLYKATELAQFERYVDFETGEIDVVAYDNAQLTLIEKQRAVVAYTRNLQVRKAGLLGMKAEYLRGLEPVDAELNRITHQEAFYMDYLLRNMQHEGISKIEAVDGTFSAEIKSNPPSVIIDDMAAIPEGFMRLPAPPPLEPNKVMIKEAIKSGIDVAGCHLESSIKLVIK